MSSYNLNNLYQRPNLGTGVTDRSLVVSSSAVTLEGSSAVPASTLFDTKTDTVLLDVQTADVMVTFDGSAPTTTNGHRLYAGQAFTWAKGTAAKAKFIAATATDAKIHASEFLV